MAIFSKFTKLSSNEKAIYPWSQRKINGSHNALPRFGHCAVMLDNRFFVIYGGTHRGSTKKNLFYIDTNNMSANSVATAGDIPSPRSFASMIMMDTFLILYGGEPVNPGEIWDPHFYVLQINTRQWSRVRTKGKIPTERAGHSACVSDDGVMYIWGGHYQRKYMNDLCAFNVRDYPAKAEWCFINYKNQGPTPRSGHISVVHDKKLYIFGGINSSHLYNDIWSFDLTTNTWEKLAAVGYIPAPRESCAAALVEDTIYIFGGRGLNGCVLGDLCAFKIKSKRWYMFQSMGIPPSPRYGHTLTVINNKIYVFGGDGESEKLDDNTHVFILDCAKIKYPPEPDIAERGDLTDDNNGRGPNELSDKVELDQKLECMHHERKDMSPPLSPIPNSTENASKKDRNPVDEEAQQYEGQRKEHQQQPQLRIDTTNVKPNVIRSHPPLTSPPPPPRPTREGVSLREQHRPNKNVPMLDPQLKPKRHSSLRHHHARLRNNKCSLPPTPPPLSSESFLDPNEKINLIKEIMTRDAIITEMRKKEQWWRTEVSIARHLRRVQGEQLEEDGAELHAALMKFIDNGNENETATTTATVEAEEEDIEPDKTVITTNEEKLSIFQQLVDTKAKVRRLRSDMTKQNQPFLKKLEELKETEKAAIEEATYYKAKYMALKSDDNESMQRLETERTKILEDRMVQAYEEQEATNQVLRQLQMQLKQEKEARSLAEERAKEAQQQSEDAQIAHQESVKQLAEVYEQTMKAEMQVRKDAAQIAELSNELAKQLQQKDVMNDDLSRIHIEMGRLEAANIKLGHEVAVLMKKLQESRDDEINLRIMLSEKDEAYTKAVHELENAYIELGLLKNMTLNTSPTTLVGDDDDVKQQQFDSSNSEDSADSRPPSMLTVDDTIKVYPVQQQFVNDVLAAV